ncbi:MAG: signal recognition particle protein [Thermoguttaceae bacterium]
MFESLHDNLIAAIKTLRGRGKLTESNMRDGLGLVEQALLEADVSLAAVKSFMARVGEQAVGERVLNALDPTQQLIGIVHQELINLMGPVDSSLHLQPGVTVIMMCGLQGSGKTTTCGKLGRMLAKPAEKPRKALLVAADLQRPAAIEQLQVIGGQLGIPVYAEPGATDPVSVCQNAVKQARTDGIDVVILDTAGRLHIDQELMDQLIRIDRRVAPQQIYLVVDSMTGQDAVNSAKAFNEALELDGVILTKLDGDARGGAAISVKAVTGVPIKFIGTGEHLDDLDVFDPGRMAGRILGMGDIVALVKKAQESLDQKEMEEQQQRLFQGQFTLADFRKMLGQVGRMGPLDKVMSLIPGLSGMGDMLQNADAEGEMKRLQGVIDAMTAAERRNPKIIDQSRRQRIADGAGVEPHEVNKLVKEFDTMAGMMKQMSGMGFGSRIKAAQQLGQTLMQNPHAALRKKKGDTGKRLTPKERAKLRKDREREARRKKREGKDGNRDPSAK